MVLRDFYKKTHDLFFWKQAMTNIDSEKYATISATKSQWLIN